MIDAGSSHSELFMFSWDADKPLGTAEDVHLKYRCFIPGKFKSFAKVGLKKVKLEVCNP